jgi:hypothetical protein
VKSPDGAVLKFPAILPRHGVVSIDHEGDAVRKPLDSLSSWQRSAIRALLREGVPELKAGIQPRNSSWTGERVEMRIEDNQRDREVVLWVPLRPDPHLKDLLPETSGRWDLI